MRKTGWLVAGALAAGVAWKLRDVPEAMGADPTGARADRVRRSPQFRGTAFANSAPAVVTPREETTKILRDLLFGREQRRPRGVIPVVTPAPDPISDLDIVWYGHATVLAEIEGRRVLFDPVWSDRCSPVPFAGPRRNHKPPQPIDMLPRLDAIVISHDHYDHLDMRTVQALTGFQDAPFVVPLGVGAHLERWGVPESRIVELDWNESVTVRGLTLTATEARHFSGRSFTRNTTLWGSWVVAGERRKVFYTGDSGYFEGYAEIGRRHGPFDVALMQIGAYSESWPDIHMTPEEAVRAHLDLNAGLLVPVHWCTFTLAFHSWGEPVDRLWREAKGRGVHLAVPRPGERFAVDEPPLVDGWWQQIE
ncbi:MBL fold metallo-hydrolase [Herbidospora cretacea]|uniref:MBL fold metallo-hydrolase n=1 Tax=Herbidospora cretacea TaxID=28444 RepID=UPI0004C2D993|nr:MBL fold metallo-hydrolase [Herbidospora cretacea]